MSRKKKRGPLRVLSAVLGFICALALGAIFYAAMVYQLGDTKAGERTAGATPAPIPSSL